MAMGATASTATRTVGRFGRRCARRRGGAVVASVERRGRPRKEVRRGDAEGVRRLLASVQVKFPDVCAGGGEASVPRVVKRDEDETGNENENEDAMEDEDETGGGSMRRIKRELTMESKLKSAASRVGAQRTLESRKKIAEKQRERWREARAKADEAAAPSRLIELEQTAAAAASAKQKRGKPPHSERNERMTKLIAMKKSTSRAEKLASSSVKVNHFSSELSRYTKLRNDLASWSDGFAQRQGRRPTFKDVQATRIPWLIESFQEYVKLRNKLIAETPNIRGEVGKLAKATLPAPRSLRMPTSGEVFLSIDDDDDDDDECDDLYGDELDKADEYDEYDDRDRRRRAKNFGLFNFK
mmetsp:Transcript_3284/g.11030  ORF Transcript_3284/g.11030 Transcript_3284/m.11030 type:complete len:356 (+) Transcript_3284:169-1236(+)